MPRPSRKEERTQGILDAYGRCIARHGVDGTTLEMTADEAGLARALIRHNVGNKDELLEAFLSRYLDRASADTDELLTSLPEHDRIETLITILFDPSYIDAESLGISNALFIAASHRPALAKRLRHWTDGFTEHVRAELAAEYPGNDVDAKTVAHGIVSIYFNFESMALLGGVKGLRETSESAARLLVSTLRG